MNCGKCMMCCKLPEIREIQSPADAMCRNCDPTVGCKIYKNRPDECRNYWCMWARMEHTGEELRPDKCHVIFDKLSDDVISAKLEIGHGLIPLVKGQIKYFNKEGYSVVAVRGLECKYFLNGIHNEEHVKRAIWQHQVTLKT